MKNILLVIIFVFIISVIFIPHEKKVVLLEKIWIDSSILWDKEEVKKIDFDENWVLSLKFDDITHRASYSWDISSWKSSNDLSWASLQFVNCFDKSKYDNFSWNLVLHRVLLWKNKSINVKLITDSPSLSMYVYKTDALSKIYPPEIEYVHACEIKLSSEEIKEINMKWNSITSDIVIWVSWSSWIINWSYTLEIEEK